VTELLAPLLRARRFDELLVTNAGAIRGHYHVSIGLEATAVALSSVHRDGDLVTTTYRNHAHLVALGSDLSAMYAEILGRDLGHQRGRAGSTHLSDPSRGVLHTSAMVSGGVPIALGQAYALSQSQQGAVCFCFFGDGAFGEGAVHESLNLARLWRLPIVFVCENNAAPRDDQANDYQSAASLLAIAEAHDLHGRAVEARHPAGVVEVLAALTEEVREGAGPRFLDAQAGRWPGNATFFPHDATGPTDVRDAAQDVDDPWRSFDDPLMNECRRLLAAGLGLDRILEVDRRITAEVQGAFARASVAPIASPEVAFSDVVGP
jgi:TPP-dependent pyruvate/acetoin dehydrogenase alpha subunit